MILPLLGALFFGCIGFVAALASRMVCDKIVPFADGPERSRPPVVVLVAGAAVVGAVIVELHPPQWEIVLGAIVMFALVAAWCSDALCGIVPDEFTLVPLAALAVLVVAQGQWRSLLWALVPVVPFAVAAAATKGRGMGWGDVKMSGLAGLALGAPLALFSLAVACGVAAVVHAARKMKKDRPIAFAPYLSAVIALALPLGVGR